MEKPWVPIADKLVSSHMTAMVDHRERQAVRKMAWADYIDFGHIHWKIRKRCKERSFERCRHIHRKCS